MFQTHSLSFELLMHVEHIHMTCIYTVKEITKSNLRLPIHSRNRLVVLTAEWSLVYFGTNLFLQCILYTLIV